MMRRASLSEFGPSPNQKPPGEAKGACGSLLISATPADMEVSKISAGVKEVRLSFITLAFLLLVWVFLSDSHVGSGEKFH